MSSEIAVRLYAMVKLGVIRSRAMFWREFSQEKVLSFELNLDLYRQDLQAKGVEVICVFDDGFCELPCTMKNSEKPFLFVYKGDVGLIQNYKNNVAVIGVLDPTVDIEKREQRLVYELVENGKVIVSGLANGVDSIAHKVCVKNAGKTIAVLPTTIDDIYPKCNEGLASDIVACGGLVISEYVNAPKDKYETISRFIERDRLQALFSSAVVLIASYSPECGDSGSRHAMQKAKEYNRRRFVMFNHNTDNGKRIFGLNQNLLEDGAVVLTNKIIKGGM